MVKVSTRMKKRSELIDSFLKETDPTKKKAIYRKIRIQERYIQRADPEQLRGKNWRVTKDMAIRKTPELQNTEGHRELLSLFTPSLRGKQNVKPLKDEKDVVEKAYDEDSIRAEALLKKLKQLTELKDPPEADIRKIYDKLDNIYKREPSLVDYHSGLILQTEYVRPTTGPYAKGGDKTGSQKDEPTPEADKIEEKIEKEVERETKKSTGETLDPDDIVTPPTTEPTEVSRSFLPKKEDKTLRGATKPLTEDEMTKTQAEKVEPVEPSDSNEGVVQPETEPRDVTSQVLTSSTVPQVDIETTPEGDIQPSVGFPTGVTNRNEEEAISTENRLRKGKSIEKLKEEIRAYHIVYDDNIPEFKKKAHTKSKDDALQSNDISVVRKHHQSMEATIREYFKTTSLKIGVIYDIGTVGRNQSSIGVAAPTGTRVTAREVSNRLGKDSMVRSIGLSDPFSKAIAGDVNPPRGGLHSHQQEPIRKLIPKPPTQQPIPGKVFNPRGGVDAPYQSILMRRSITGKLPVSIKTGSDKAKLCL